MGKVSAYYYYREEFYENQRVAAGHFAGGLHLFPSLKKITSRIARKEGGIFEVAMPYREFAEVARTLERKKETYSPAVVALPNEARTSTVRLRFEIPEPESDSPLIIALKSTFSTTDKKLDEKIEQFEYGLDIIGARTPKEITNYILALTEAGVLTAKEKEFFASMPYNHAGMRAQLREAYDTWERETVQSYAALLRLLFTTCVQPLQVLTDLQPSAITVFSYDNSTSRDLSKHEQELMLHDPELDTRTIITTVNHDTLATMVSKHYNTMYRSYKEGVKRRKS